jgi:hypothetical protein
MALAEWTGNEPKLRADALVLQVDVDATYRALGGYWRPLATVTRLLEECGEVAEADTLDELVDECADVVITATGLATQLNIGLRPYYADSRLPENLTVPVVGFQDGLVRLVSASGHLARAVNATVGDKPMKPGHQVPCIGGTITAVHAAAAALGNLGGRPFLAAIGEKLAHTRVRDAGRFTGLSLVRDVPAIGRDQPPVADAFAR